MHINLTLLNRCIPNQPPSPPKKPKKIDYPFKLRYRESNPDPSGLPIKYPQTKFLKALYANRYTISDVFCMSYMVQSSYINISVNDYCGFNARAD